MRTSRPTIGSQKTRRLRSRSVERFEGAEEVHANPALRLELVMKIAGMDKATAETIPEAWFESHRDQKEAFVPNYDTLIRPV